jgi:hypothetical protein
MDPFVGDPQLPFQWKRGNTAEHQSGDKEQQEQSHLAFNAGNFLRLLYSYPHNWIYLKVLCTSK